MQGSMLDSIALLGVMISSWLVSFISQYLIIGRVMEKTPWNEKTQEEKKKILSGYGLGAFPGVIIFLVLGSLIIVTEEPVLLTLNLPLFLTWILLLIVVGALGGHLAIQTNQTDENE